MIDGASGVPKLGMSARVIRFILALSRCPVCPQQRPNGGHSKTAETCQKLPAIGAVHPALPAATPGVLVAIVSWRVLFEPDDRGEIINRDAWHVDGVLNGACVSVAYRHATQHYLVIVDG